MGVGVFIELWPGAARAGVENLTRSLAVEWAESGVRVNSLAPGSSIFSPTASDNYSTEFSPFEMARPGVPAKRLGTTLEVTIRQEILILRGGSNTTSFVFESVRLGDGPSPTSCVILSLLPSHTLSEHVVASAKGSDTTFDRGLAVPFSWTP